MAPYMCQRLLCLLAAVEALEGGRDTCALSESCDSPSNPLAALWELFDAFDLRPSSAFRQHDPSELDAECNLERISLQSEGQRVASLIKKFASGDTRDARPFVLTDLRSEDAQKAVQASMGNAAWLMKHLGTLKMYSGPPVKLPTAARTKLKDYMRASRKMRVNLSSDTSALSFDYQFKYAPMVPPPMWETTRVPMEDRFLEDYLEPPEFVFQPKHLGLPFHAHGFAFNEVLSGRKHWLFYPSGWGCDEAALEASSAPLASYMPEKWRDAVSWDGVERTCESLLGAMIHGYVNVSQDHYLDSAATCRASGTCDARHDPGSTLVSAWVLDVLPQLDARLRPPYRCTVQPGEAMVVPANTWHATLNLDETIIFVKAGSPGQNKHRLRTHFCSLKHDEERVEVQFWNLHPEPVSIYFRNQTTGKALKQAEISAATIYPGYGTYTLRSYVGLKFHLWRGEPMTGVLSETVVVGRQVDKFARFSRPITDVMKWDFCTFDQ